jgi:uncharacterized membrane protein YcaP (DUF421 family)
METIVRALIGYFILLAVVRLLKRRAGAQMTLFEFVLIFLIGGIIILSTVGKDRSLTNCTCAVIAVGLIHRLVAWAKSKSPRLGRLVDGTPLVIIRNGTWQGDVARRMGIRREDVAAAARAKGVTAFEVVDYAVLERNGGISIFEKPQPEDR